MNGKFWADKKVLLTGHTGFKGSWTSLLLHSLGARVTGLSLPADAGQNLYTAAGVSQSVDAEFFHDLRDREGIAKIMREIRPDVMLHMAAQSLVKESYADPVGTFATNIMGTVHLLEASRCLDTRCAIVNITSDKCYENREWLWPYRENEAMGGSDPYSCSKGSSELVTASYRRSFFSGTNISLASARAGNVIGGGDWAKDRLVPDIVRAGLSGETLSIRFPNAIRPWQFVLEPISGYLRLAERLFVNGKEFEQAWNFGPDENAAQPVHRIVQSFLGKIGSSVPVHIKDPDLHEAQLLKLDWNKAKHLLAWNPQLGIDECLDWTAQWYLASAKGQNMRAFTLAQIAAYLDLTRTGASKQ